MYNYSKKIFLHKNKLKNLKNQNNKTVKNSQPISKKNETEFKPHHLKTPVFIWQSRRHAMFVDITASHQSAFLIHTFVCMCCFVRLSFANQMTVLLVLCFGIWAIRSILMTSSLFCMHLNSLNNIKYKNIITKVFLLVIN